MTPAADAMHRRWAGLNMVLIRNHERGASTPFNAPDMYDTGDIGNGAQLAANNPANITVSPRGGLLLCEDGGSSPDQYGPGSRLIGLTYSGESYYFAKNNAELTDIQIAGAEKSVPEGDFPDSEFCGACWDPRGETLFVNMQSPGITFSITGPWRRGNQCRMGP